MPGGRPGRAMARLVDSADFERVAGPPSRGHDGALRRASSRRHRARRAACSPEPRRRVINNRWLRGARPVEDLRATARRRPGSARSCRSAMHARAVTRSLLKRQIYAAVGAARDRLAPGLWIVRLRAPFERAASRARPRRRCAQRRARELDALLDAGARRADRMSAWPQRRGDALIALVRAYRFSAAPGSAAPAASSRPARPTRSTRSSRHGAAPAPAWRRGRIARCHPWCAGGIDPVPARRRASSPRCSAAPRVPRPPHFRSRHDRYPPHPALGGVPRLAVLHLGRLEQAQRPAVDVRAAAARVAAPARRTRAGADRRAGRAAATVASRRRCRPRRPADGARRVAAGAGRAGAGRERAGRRSRPTSSAPPSTATARTLVRARTAEARRSDRSPEATWCCSTDRRAPLRRRRPGLVPAAGGVGAAEPPHADERRCPASARSTAGQNELRCASSRRGRRRQARQDLHLQRGDYVIDVSTRSSTRRRRRSTRGCTCSWCATATPPGGSSFYFTFTGPAIYTESRKYKKIDFKDIEKREPGDKPDHRRPDERLGRDGPALLRVGLAGRQARRARPREFFTGKVDTNTLLGRHAGAAGRDRARARPRPRRQAVRRPAGGRLLATLAPGLELVKDYGCFKILAEPLFWLLTSCTRSSATGAGRSSAWSCC